MAQHFVYLDLSEEQLAGMAAAGTVGDWLAEQLIKSQNGGQELVLTLDGHGQDFGDVLTTFELQAMACDCEECRVCGTPWTMAMAWDDGSQLGYCACCSSFISFVEDEEPEDRAGYNPEADPESDREHMEDWHA